MSKKPNRKSTPPITMTPEMLSALFKAEHQPDHNLKWSLLRPDIARDALIKAQELRESDMDSGDAYLLAIADLNHRFEHERTLKELVTAFDPNKEPSGLTDD